MSLDRETRQLLEVVRYRLITLNHSFASRDPTVVRELEANADGASHMPIDSGPEMAAIDEAFKNGSAVTDDVRDVLAAARGQLADSDGATLVEAGHAGNELRSSGQIRRIDHDDSIYAIDQLIAAHGEQSQWVNTGSQIWAERW